MKSAINQRLVDARKALCLNQRDFAKPLGVHHTAVSQWEVGKTSLASISAKAIEQVYNISADWLMTGKGEMMIDASKTTGAPSPCDTTEASLPILPLMLCNTKEPPVMDRMSFKKDWLYNRIGVAPEHLFLTQIENDAMSPSLNPGDIVMIDKSASKLAFQNGLWVFGLGNAVHLMRLQQIGVNTFRATSDNPAYSVITLNKAPHLIGRVVWSDKRW